MNTGGVLSSTVMVWTQLVLFPLASVAVQVRVGHVRSGQGEVQARGDPQGALVHAPDHDLEPGRVCQGLCG